jgi:hypothetical protein
MFVTFFDVFVCIDPFVFFDHTADGFAASCRTPDTFGDISASGNKAGNLAGSAFIDDPTTSSAFAFGYLLVAGDIIAFFDHAASFEGFSFDNGD